MSGLKHVSALFVLFALTTGPCVGDTPHTQNPPASLHAAEDASYVDMIKSAIQDEMLVATPIGVARGYGVESAGTVSLELDVLIAPFSPSTSGFSTHVIYLVPGYGYVIRQVTVYPKEGVALFWLGYSAQGPGEDAGINCTHSHSNCKISDIPFGDLKSAFCSWWQASVKIEIGNLGEVRNAKRRNLKRSGIMRQS